MSSDIEREREDLDCVLVNENSNPVRLSYGVLKTVTHDFSHELGSGGFGKVYRGFLPSGDIAVKEIHIGVQFNDNIFQEEVECLTKANHKNIVRILGYCSETHRELVPYNEGHVWADIPKRLLCFEYVPNGNLGQYLKDTPNVGQRLNRYRVIKGICEGLHFLHGIKINHLDLKPDNVMLDDNMEPKITDFGLSRFVDDKMSTIVATNNPGTLGYMAPEVIHSSELSLRADIYSLGIIMKQVITGCSKIIDLEKCDESLYLDDPGMKECMEIAESCVQIEQRRRPTIVNIIDDLNEIEKKYKLIPVTSRPLDIGLLELHCPFSLDKRIPCSLKLVNKTDELVAFRLMEKGIQGSSILILPLYGIVQPNSTTILEVTTKILEKKPCKQGYSMTLQTTTPKNKLFFYDNYSLERRFLEKDKDTVIQTSQVIMKTVFRLREVSTTQDVLVKDMIDIHPRELHVALESNKHITCSLQLTNKTYERVAFKVEEEEGSPNLFDIQALTGIVVLPRSTCTLVLTTKKMKCPPEWQEGHLILKCLWEGKLVHVATVKTFCGTHIELTSEVPLSLQMLYSPPRDLLCFDINPCNQWIITGHESGYARIWHCTEKKQVDFVRVCDKEVRCVKFIGRKQWFIACSGDGFIKVYDYETKIKKIQQFKASECSITSLAIHPTQTYVLASSNLGTIKLWDWDQNWEAIRTFQEKGNFDIVQIAFNPMDSNSFASASGCRNSFWELSSVRCLYSLPGHSKKVNCLDYFTIDEQQHMITGSDDQTAKIWNLEDAMCVKTLDVFTSRVTCVSSHPNLPVIVTGTANGTVILWSSSTLRLEKILNLSCWGEVIGIRCMMGLERRIVIGQEKAISWLTIENMDYQDGSTMSHEHDLCMSPAETKASKISPVPRGLLGIQLKLHFSLEARDQISYSVLHLICKTDERVAFRLMDKTGDQMRFFMHPLYGILEPGSTDIYLMGIKMVDIPQQKQEVRLIMQNCIYGDQHAYPVLTEDDYESIFKEVKELGLVHEETLTAIFGLQGETISGRTPRLMEILYMLPQGLLCFDVNPLKQWIIIGDSEGFVRVWNYQTRKLVDSTRVFNKEVAVHPTQPYVLSSGTGVTCDSIELWDWSNEWEATHTFESNGGSPITFNPVDANSFASASHKIIQVWNLNSADPMYTLSGHSEKVNCLDYFTCGDIQYLISGSDDWSAKVWDLEQKMCIQTLHAFFSAVTSVGFHPNLSILITGSRDGTVVLWSSSTFRVKKIMNFPYFGEVIGLSCVMGSGRILIGQKKGISLLTMDNIDYESSRALCEQNFSVETSSGNITRTDKASKESTSPIKLLDVQQLQFHFPLELGKYSCSLLLNNKTNERVAFRLTGRDEDSGSFKKFPWYGIILPGSSYSLIVTTRKINESEKQELDLILESNVYGDQHNYPLETEEQYDIFFSDVKEMGRVMHEVTLTAVFGLQEERTCEIISMPKLGQHGRYFDVSPSGRWILRRSYEDQKWNIDIWNYETEGPGGFVSFPLCSGVAVRLAKFIARKHWFLVGDSDGLVHVYDYATTLQNIKTFRAHKSSVCALAVHPTKPYVLTCTDRRMKLWDWENSWACRKEIKLDYGCVWRYSLHLTSNFAIAFGNNIVKVWYLDSPSSAKGLSQYHCFPGRFDSSCTLRGHSGTVLCVDYFSSGGQQYLITGSKDKTAKIWDLETKTCVRTLDASCAGAVTAACPHPNLPVLITGSEDGTVRFWSSTTFSLEKVLNFGFGETVEGLRFSEDSGRFVIWYEGHIAIIEGNSGNPASVTMENKRRNSTSETEK